MLGARIAENVADLDAVFGKETLAPELFGLNVFGMHTPGAHALLRLELDQHEALSALCDEELVRNIARHGDGEFGLGEVQAECGLR
jgi:hypothetical protein